MKSHAHLSIILSIALVLITFYGCRKIDYHYKDPAQKCKIIETDERFFTYNTYGNPKWFTYKENPGETGKPTFYFEFDSRQRLIAYGSFSNHYLTYNSKGLAVIDTVIQNYAGQDARFSDQLFYDHYGRIVKVISEWYWDLGQPLPLPHPKETIYYNYDKNGNLISPDGPGIFTYDNKTNIRRTNPIFMLVDRDYSVNNLVGSTQYNFSGLPFTFYDTFLDGRGVEQNIVYDCGSKSYNDK